MTTPDDSYIDLYCAITYASQANYAAAFAGNTALDQNDRASLTLAQAVIEDAYCATGFAWRATNSDGTFEIEYCVKDAERARDAAIARAAQVLEGALDVDPFIMARRNEAMQSLLKSIELFKTLIYHMNMSAEYLNYEGVDTAEARKMFIEDFESEPPPMPDAQMIQDAWNTLRERYPRAFFVPNTLSSLAAELMADREGEGYTAEQLADEIASRQAAERGPKGECRYCGVSFDKAKESVNPGRCLICDKTLITEMMADMFDVFAYDPETGESVYGDLPKADESDADSHSLN
jgi:hypothetical protein